MPPIYNTPRSEIALFYKLLLVHADIYENPACLVAWKIHAGRVAGVLWVLSPV